MWYKPDNSLFIGLYISRFPSLFAQHFATSLQILQLNCSDPDPTPKHIPMPTHNSKFARFPNKLVCSNKKEKSSYVILNELSHFEGLSVQGQRKRSVFAGCWVYKGSRILSHDQAWSWCMRRRWMDAGNEDQWLKGIKSSLFKSWLTTSLVNKLTPPVKINF